MAVARKLSWECLSPDEHPNNVLAETILRGKWRACWITHAFEHCQLKRRVFSKINCLKHMFGGRLGPDGALAKTGLCLFVTDCRVLITICSRLARFTIVLWPSRSTNANGASRRRPSPRQKLKRRRDTDLWCNAIAPRVSTTISVWKWKVC
jgi:hypothetical protein